MFADLRYAARMLRMSPGFALLVVLLLALGIGANTAMFSILDAWILEPLPLPAANQLTIVLKSEATSPGEPKIFVGYRDWKEYARQSRSFRSIAGVFWRNLEARDGGDGVFGMIVTANLFDTLQVKPERGRTFRSEDVDGPPVAVIGHDLWKNRFAGAANIIGKTLALGSKTYQIIGVMPPEFGVRMINQGIDPQFYALIQKDEPAYSGDGAGPIAAIGRLKPGITAAVAQTELAGIQRSLDERHPDNPKGFTVLVTSLQKDNTRNVRASLLLSAGALGFILLIVCGNVGSLQLGRTLKRQREIAIRAALGSGPRRIVRQLLTENALISVLGLLGGLGIAYGSLEVFGAVNPFGRMPQNTIGIDWRALAFTVLASVMSLILFGLTPALQAARVDLNEAMKTRSVTGTAAAFRLRRVLIAGQVALAMILVVGAGLMTETLAHLVSQPLGLRTQGITVADVAIPKQRWNDVAARLAIYDRVLERLKSTAGVEDAAISNAGPLDGGFAGRFSIAGRPAATEEAAPKAATQSVTPDYFSTLGIPLIGGRSFTQHDKEDSTLVVILNQNAAERYFGVHGSIGERIKLEEDKEWRTVVGVVGDTSYTFYNTLEWLKGPKIFLPARQAGKDSTSPVESHFYAVIRGGTMTTETVRAVLKSADTVLRLGRLQTLHEIIGEVVQQPRLRTRLLGGLAAFSLLLASIGIYGLMAQSVVQRTQEIGIRMALGARASDVVRMVVGQGFRLALVGIAAGIAAALAMARIIASLLYGVKPADILTFGASALVLLIAVALAALLPARAAARVDPLVALRQE